MTTAVITWDMVKIPASMYRGQLYEMKDNKVLPGKSPGRDVPE
jgi:hypothetical protein